MRPLETGRWFVLPLCVPVTLTRRFRVVCSLRQNTVTRVSLHEHGVMAEGLDGCGDCTAETYILERYLERYPNMLATAAGSQMTVTPQASAPAASLKLDTTKFKDPAWQAKQAAKRRQFLITLENDTTDGQPMTEEQIKAATEKFDAEQAADAAGAGDADMDGGAAAATAAAASAAATGADAAMEPSPPGDAAMDDAPAELTPLEQLKQNVGRFSQEVSCRLTKGGLRSLAVLNDKMIARVSFSRKNRA